MSGQQGSIIKRYGDWIIIGVLYLFYIFPVVQPFTLPIPVGEKAQTMYNLIEALPEGATVCVAYDYAAVSYPLFQGIQEAFYTHVWRKGGRIVMVAFSAHGPMMYKQMLKTYNDGFSKKTYGVDWCFLGFIPGGETALASFMANIRGVVTTDFEGNPIESLTIMKNVNSATDFDLVFDFETETTLGDGFVRQVSSAYGVKVGMAMSGGQLLEPYYPTQIQALPYPLPGVGAEYEKLVGTPGNATAQIAILFVGNLLYILLLIGGQLFQFIRRGFK